MQVTRTVAEDGTVTYEPRIATGEGPEIEFARLQWRAGLSSLECGLDVGVIKCGHSYADDGTPRYHAVVDGIPQQMHFDYAFAWHQLVGISIGACAARERLT